MRLTLLKETRFLSQTNEYNAKAENVQHSSQNNQLRCQRTESYSIIEKKRNTPGFLSAHGAPVLRSCLVQRCGLQRYHLRSAVGAHHGRAATCRSKVAARLKRAHNNYFSYFCFLGALSHCNSGVIGNCRGQVELLA